MGMPLTFHHRRLPNGLDIVAEINPHAHSFAAGFYVAQLYGEISALIEQRRAALTSAIFSAPFPIRAGDDLDRSGLMDRLAQLSYSQVPVANTPGEYTKGQHALAVYLRAFHVGAKEYPSEMVRVRLDGTRIAGVADAFVNDIHVHGQSVGGAAQWAGC